MTEAIIVASVGGSVAIIQLYTAFRQHFQGRTLQTIEVNTNSRLTQLVSDQANTQADLKAANAKIDTLMAILSAIPAGGKHLEEPGA